MSSNCNELHAFADGELDAEAAEAFRAHLVGCPRCAGKLPEILEILAAFDDAEHQGGKQRAARPLSGVARSARRAFAPEADQRRTSRRGRRVMTLFIAAVLTFTSVIVLLWLWPGKSAPARRSPFAVLPMTRPIPVRLAYADPNVAAHREYAVGRGSQPDPGDDEVPLAAFAELERRKDWHGVAVAMLLSGNPGEASRYLARLPASPAVDTDRGAVALVEKSEEGLDRALRLLDGVLAAEPDNSAARWNRALALERLHLPLTAAEDFERVAAKNEPGWSREASARAVELRREAEGRRAQWSTAVERGRELLAGHEISWDDLAPLPPGILRLYFYDALRSAPDRAAVVRLLPIAGNLDAAFGGEALTRQARAVLAADFSVRGPLAQEYRGIALEGRTVDPAALDRLAGRLRAAGAADIWLGLMAQQRAIARHLDAYRKAAAATGDPWFEAMAEQAAAKDEIAGGQAVAAERRLLAASRRALAQRITYRKLLIDLDLVDLDRSLGRLPEAEERALAVQREAHAAGEWNIETDAIGRLAETTRFRYSLARARAYLREFLAREPAEAPCAKRRYVHQALANVAMIELDPATARAELAAAPACGQPITTLAAGTLADLYRFGGTAEDAAGLRRELADLRARGGLDEAQQALVDHIEGRLLVELDRQAGRALLRSAIERGAAAGGDTGRKARAYSFSVLALDAGRAGENDMVFDLLAEELRTDAPARCALAAAVEDERSVVVALDRAGQSTGAYSARRASADIDFRNLVPPELRVRLAACEQVTVLARPPVLGSPGLLPPEMAWSYRVGATPATRRPRTGPRLVVADAEPPAETRLAPLAPHLEDEAGAVVLRGPSATPRRVLAAMRDASTIELHAHGFIDRGLSDASYLALSPDEDGWYALTAADLAKQRLTDSPIVILAACHAGRPAPFLDEALGLPLAFVRAGALAVVASPATVDDRAASSFFRAVRVRIDAGAPPAVAVRDARAAQAADRAQWVGEVVVYE